MVGHRHARAGLLRTLSVIAVLGGALAAPAIVAGGDPCFHDLSRPAVTSGSLTTVSIAACTFEPGITRVPSGSTVTFRNASPQGHLVTGVNMKWGSEKAMLQPGASVSYRFASAGVFPYTCMLHPGMTGAVIVGDVRSADAGAVTSDPSGSTGRADAGGGLGGWGGVAAAGSLLALLGLAVLGLRRRLAEAHG